MDGGDKNVHAIRTHEEVAAIMTERGDYLTRGRVWQIERSALRKIREAMLADFGTVFISPRPPKKRALRSRR